ncbi:hypothetical protein [Alteromonas sp. AMM-1]|uniref:hypothetical protein n=1 Tax=Alteromonas sp. AMM-1 TaxID=3394233 RepID=UPI0039A5869C
MVRRFSMHGSLEVRVENRVLVLSGSGPWNSESLQLTDASIMQQVKALYGSPWGVLGLFSGEAVYVPEAIQTLQKQVSQELKLGRVATAVVLNNVQAPRLSQYQFELIYSSCGHALEFFDGEAIARRWLQAQIAAAQSDARFQA